MARAFLRFLNGAVTLAVALALAVAGLYAGFALWDNQQIYAAAENVFDEMREIKATAGEGEGLDAGDGQEQTPFEQMQAINPDVTGWVTMPNTAIDYPLLQGRTNMSYINTDVYGNFALAGSVFLDSRNSRDYSDPYSLLYGHNMSKHRMFADVNLYKDEAFFQENQRGVLLLPESGHILQSISCIVTPASNSTLFNPDNWLNMSPDQILDAVQMDALYVSEAGMTALRAQIDAGVRPRIVALSTCSDEFTDARTILLTLIDP